MVPPKADCLMIDPELDPIALREQAKLFERFAAEKRHRADIIELSVITAALSGTDATGKRGIDLLMELDPMQAGDAQGALRPGRRAGAPHHGEGLTKYRESTHRHWLPSSGWS